MNKEIRLDQGYRIDLLVEQRVVVETKAVDQIAPVHEGAVLSEVFRMQDWPTAQL